MESGVLGAPGAIVVRPVEREEYPGLESVILLLQLMEERPALELKLRIKFATMDLVKVRMEISIYLIDFIFKSKIELIGVRIGHYYNGE